MEEQTIVLMLRNNTSKTYFEIIVGMNDGLSDIGLAFTVNSWFDMFNPCFEILKLPILGKYPLDTIPYERK